MINQKSESNQNERFYLWWLCPQTQSRDMVGIAYYNEKDGDYRLILNFFPDNNYFLKCIGASSEQCRYRLVAVKERGGKSSRFFQGDGILNNETGEIVIQTAPFSKFLVMTLNGVSSRANLKEENKN